MCFRQQLDVVLAKCTCWDTAVGTEGPFCKDRGAPRSRVGKKVAASAAATAADDHRDPSAVAEAAKKADDAMDALVVSCIIKHTLRNPSKSPDAGGSSRSF